MLNKGASKNVRKRRLFPIFNIFLFIYFCFCWKVTGNRKDVADQLRLLKIYIRTFCFDYVDNI